MENVSAGFIFTDNPQEKSALSKRHGNFVYDALVTTTMMMMFSGTGGADGQSRQGPVESCSSVLSLQPDQTVLNQLTQRRRETLQDLLHLETTPGLRLICHVRVVEKCQTSHRCYLFKRGVAPELLAGQAEIQWTHRSLLHQQRLELQVHRREDEHVSAPLTQLSSQAHMSEGRSSRPGY